MNTDNIKLNGTVIQGGSLRYPKTPNLLLGENKGYERGDILDANAVSKLIEEGGGGGDPEEIEKIKQDLQKKADKTELPTKVSDLENDSQFVTADAIEGYGERLDNLDEQMSTKASESYVDDAVSQMGDALDNAKVDKVEGKDLSTNDYTDEDKAKVDSITPQVQADWAENDNTSKAYVQNRTHYEYEDYKKEIGPSGQLGNVKVETGISGHNRLYLQFDCFDLQSERTFDIWTIYFRFDENSKSFIAPQTDWYKLTFTSDSDPINFYFYKVSGDDLYYIVESSSGSIDKVTNLLEDSRIQELIPYKYGTFELYTKETVYKKLDNKYLNIDTQLSTASNNPVSNKAITTTTNNLSTLINETRSNLNNYYTKLQTYSQAEINALLDAARNGLFVPVAELPEPSADCIGKIYLIDATTTQESNYKDEYICFYKQDTEEYSWEKIGSATVNLDNYYTKSEVNELVEQSNVQSDWNENDSTQKSYIANRTHYVEEEPVIESFVDEPVSITLLEKLVNPGSIHPVFKVRLTVGQHQTQYTINVVDGDWGMDTDPIYTGMRLKDGRNIYISAYEKDNLSGGSIGLCVIPEGKPTIDSLIYSAWNATDKSGTIYQLGPKNLTADLIGEDIVHKLDNKYIDSSSIVDSTSELPVQTKAVAEYVDSKEQSITNYIDSKQFQKYYDYDSKTTFTVPALGSETPYTVQVDLPSDLTADWRIGGVMTHAIKDANGNRIYASIVQSFTMQDQTAVKVSFMGCSSSAKQAAELQIKFILIKR